MPHIQQLSPHVADLIAAGEVVERPASVVKELVENAIDAGATAIVTEIRRGGMGLIRVTDNGCGIAPEELPTAFLRHATSKLRREEDLAAIGTLGFRGEALAAISAVSRVEILTRTAGAQHGAVLRLEGGVAGQVETAGAPEGTTIAVRDLFYNTPARLKFMRKDSAETAAVAGLMQHLALSHPDVSFKFLKDGVEALHTPGDGKLDSAIYAALGRDFARGLVPVRGRSGDVAVDGFVTAPLQGRGSRSMQVFFVNGRFIKSQLLTAALEEGYRNQIMKGKFPGCVLAVTVPVTAVDVNVHPAKTQVKFAREKEVFDTVYHTVLDALDAFGGAVPAPEKAVRETVNPRQDFFQTMDAKTYRTAAAQPAQTPKAPPARPVWNTEWKAGARVADSGAAPRTPAPRPALGGAPVSVRQIAREAAEETAPAAPVREAVPARPPVQAAAPEKPVEQGRPVTPAAEPACPVDRTPAVPAERPVPHSAGQPAQTADMVAPAQEKLPGFAGETARPFVPAIPDGDQVPGQQTLAREAPWRIAGEVLHTYIVCESADGCVWLIDKHAAHERMNFDRLMASRTPPMRQTLLQPVAADVSREDRALLLEHAAVLEELGFGCEDFGEGAILVREVPADLDTGDIQSTLEELAEDLRNGRDPDQRRENLLHTIACKAAIKGGWESDPAELKVLVAQVQSGAVRFCPHGRPVAVKLTGRELEKMFKRA